MLLVPTLLLTLDPVRLGLILLLITRPRPLQSLCTYWVGAMTSSVPYMLVPLTVLHLTPSLRSFAERYATPATLASPAVRHTQIGIGVVALSIAAVLAARLRARRRATVAAPAGAPSTLPPGRDAATRNGSARRGWRARTYGAWENGSIWPAFVFGVLSGPPPLTALLVLTTIMASGAAIGAQVGLALVWVVGMFAVVEIILLSHLAAPAKTHAALQFLHDWILAHRRQVLITMVAVAGVAMLALGVGGGMGAGR
ncbi:GAP family protein [Mycobacterium palustre]|uniref:Gap protein n=1 Tax=Mycobacterium palustre TaxID=153971 RepID=A0A1X1ZX08_9MYCO|nr:GAP family protein [Mycobacterium palustre]MCV7099854.1 GAP family protein [Mycobacterium palustre]ORW28895.1 hypothetical protein AWC19_26205 [Mycobacterium palustre]